MRLTRRRRRKIYKGIGIGAIIVLIVWLIIINPFKYIHIEIKPKEESTVIKNDETKEAEEQKQKEAEEAAKRLEEQKKKAEEEAAKKKAEEEAAKKKAEEEKKKQQEQTQKEVYYTATFFNKDGSVIKSITLKAGSVPYYNGDTPEYYDGIYYYQFVGWDRSFTAITGNTTYIAQYEIVGSVPKPKPDPKPTPVDPEPTPIDPEPEPEYIEEDLSAYNLLSIKNIGTNEGRIQIIKGVGDYSEFEEPFNSLVAPEIYLQYSKDKKTWYDFDSYGEYDICGVILNSRKYTNEKGKGVSIGQTLGIEIPRSVTNAEEPLIIEPEETIYFRVPTNKDNPGFSQMVSLVSEKYSLEYLMPCVNIFDIQGVETPDSTTFEISGELMSVIDDGYVKNGKDNGKKVTKFNDLGFAGLFANISDDLFYEITGNEISPYLKLEGFDCHTGDNIVNAIDFKLPNSEDIDNIPVLCYAYMFADSNKLTDAPNVDVGILGDECYEGLFATCNSLVDYPYILDTPLESGCYSEMFSNCDNLTTVDEGMLPQVDLVDRCYRGMFKGTSLEVLPELPADILKEYCYASMYEGCSTLDSIDNMSNYLGATQLAPACYQSMFKDSSIDELPYLYATTLTNQCYSNMFSGCYKLSNVSPTYLGSTELAPLCYDSMFAGSSITSAPNLPATTVYEGSYYCMFMNCESLVNGPVIDAKTIEDYIDIPAFSGMFYDCSKLSKVTLTNDEWSIENVSLLTGMFQNTNSLVFDGESEVRRLLLLYQDLSQTEGLKQEFCNQTNLDEEYWDIRFMQKPVPHKLPFFFSFFRR